jgi:hypothetical protein
MRDKTFRVALVSYATHTWHIQISRFTNRLSERHVFEWNEKKAQYFTQCQK